MDSNKTAVLIRAEQDLRAVNEDAARKCGTADTVLDSEIVKQRREAEELEILDTVVVEFGIYQKLFEIRMLDQLNVLLASTARKPPKSDKSNATESRKS
jgi:hypothetical protein